MDDRDRMLDAMDELRSEDINGSYIDSLSDYLDRMPSSDDHLFFYRGQSNHEWDLIPGIYRDKKYSISEYQIITDVEVMCPNDFSEHGVSSFEKLAKMQHYGLPTRLLDISLNPLVALYFACCDENEKDKEGQVVVYKIPKDDVKYFDSDAVSVVSNIAWMKSGFSIDAGLDYSRGGNGQKLVHKIRNEKPYFLENIEEKDIESVICVVPRKNNQRIIKQDGAFLLFGMDGEKSKPASIPLSWRYDFDPFVVMACMKDDILAELERVGISESTVYPELEKVTSFLKKKYKS